MRELSTTASPFTALGVSRSAPSAPRYDSGVARQISTFRWPTLVGWVRSCPARRSMLRGVVGTSRSSLRRFPLPTGGSLSNADRGRQRRAEPATWIRQGRLPGHQPPVSTEPAADPTEVNDAPIRGDAPNTAVCRGHRVSRDPSTQETNPALVSSTDTRRCCSQHFRSVTELPGLAGRLRLTGCRRHDQVGGHDADAFGDPHEVWVVQSSTAIVAPCRLVRRSASIP